MSRSSTWRTSAPPKLVTTAARIPFGSLSLWGTVRSDLRGAPRLRRGHSDRRRPERGVLVERPQALLATEAALADTAEGELDAGADAPAVDVHLAGADLAREPEGAVDV